MAVFEIAAAPGDRSRGILTAPSLPASIAVALGRSGCTAAADKREGDGATPLGLFPLRRLFWRPDRLSQPRTGIPMQPLSPNMGWCDDPNSPSYNRLVTLPFAASHEVLWRADAVYDLILVIGHNDDPPAHGLGSAIFIHLARPGYEPTEGCVAMQLADMLGFIRVLRAGDAVNIVASPSRR